MKWVTTSWTHGTIWHYDEQRGEREDPALHPRQSPHGGRDYKINYYQDQVTFGLENFSPEWI